MVLLDSGPLGMVTNPKASEETNHCNLWLEGLLSSGVTVAIPEISDYEVRRELLRASKTEGIRRLDALKMTLDYLPITTPVMLKAAELWAEARRQGRPTADDKSLDGDVILAAQALSVGAEGDDVMIATTNVVHLALFVNARVWERVSSA